MKSNFHSDLTIESHISNFIDKYLYSKIFKYFKRTESIEDQFKGIDVKATLDGEELLIDDKCAFYYANRNLNSFTFELSYIKNNSLKTGWLLNSNLYTSFFNVMWLNTFDTKIKPVKIKEQDIQVIESMFIHKKSLLSYLETIGLSNDRLIELDYEIRKSGLNRKKLTPDIELIISNQLNEKPINLKISKSLLSKIATYHYKIQRNKLINLKNNETINELIPQIRTNGIEAELKVYKAVQKYANKREDCYSFLNFPLHKENFQGKREIDILVVDRELGITVIEVKGIKINQIKNISGGIWYFNDFYTEVGNPYKQGEKQLNDLCNRIEKNPIFVNSITKRVIVALPYITRFEWESRGFHKKIDIPPVLLKEDLDYINKIESYYIYKAKSDLDNLQWNVLKEFFSIESNKVPYTNNMLSPYKEIYSALYVFYNHNQFKLEKGVINRLLQEGTKIWLLCYFNIEKLEADWLNDYSEFCEKYQLLYFISTVCKEYQDFIEIIDGEVLPSEDIICDFPNFNNKQYEIIHTPISKNLMVKAGAGTGKTHVMIDRIIFLLSRGVALKDIIMITFTNEATNEMKERLYKKLTSLSILTGKLKYALHAEEIKDMQINTIHSYSKTILMTLAHEMGYGKNINIKSFNYEKKEIIGNLINDFYIKHNSHEKLNELRHYEIVDLIYDFWEEMEKKGLSSKEIKRLDWGEVKNPVYKLFNNLFEFVFDKCEDELNIIKKNENAVSINDLVREIKKFCHSPNIMSQINNNKYLFLDEFQDSDNVQIELVASLAKYLNYKLFVVGDIKQSIYRFRGADYKSFQVLEDKLMNTSDIDNINPIKKSLNQNYRTYSSLLDKLDLIFAEWDKRKWLKYDEKLIGMNKREKIDSELQLIQYNDKEEIENKVINAIKTSLKRIDEIPGDQNKKIAILVRTNTQAKEVNKWCQRAKIPTIQNLDGTFYISQAVIDFKTLLDGLLYPNEAKYVINALQSPYFRYKIPYKLLLPFAGNNSKIIQFINSTIGDTFTKYVDLLKTLPIMAVIQKIIFENKLYENLPAFYKDKISEVDMENFVLKYRKNLSHLLNTIQTNFDVMNTTIHNIYDWLTIQMRTNRNEDEPRVEASFGTVEIITVHRSKGLQYNTVIIPNTSRNFSYIHSNSSFYVEEESEKRNFEQNKRKVAWKINKIGTHSTHFPKLKSFNDKELYKEETRLLYVAMTRVIDNLIIFLPKKPVKNSWSEILHSGIKVVQPNDR